MKDVAFGIGFDILLKYYIPTDKLQALHATTERAEVSYIIVSNKPRNSWYTLILPRRAYSKIVRHGNSLPY